MVDQVSRFFASTCFEIMLHICEIFTDIQEHIGHLHNTLIVQLSLNFNSVIQPKLMHKLKLLFNLLVAILRR